MAGNVSVTNNLVVSAGSSLATNNNNLSDGALTNLSGTLTLSAASVAVYAFQNLTVNSGGSYTDSSAATSVTFGVAGTGGVISISNSGTFTDTDATTYTLQGPGGSFSGSLTIPSVTVTNTGTYTNNGTLNVTTTLTGLGTLINAASGTLDIGGAATAGFALTAWAVGNTVNYDGGAAQTLLAGPYYNLQLSNSAKNFTHLTEANAITGNLTIQSGASMTNDAATLTVAGALIYTSAATTTLANVISIGTLNQTAGILDAATNGVTVTVTGTGLVWQEIAGGFTSSSTVIFNGAAPTIGGPSFFDLQIGDNTHTTAAILSGATTLGGTAANALNIFSGSSLTENAGLTMSMPQAPPTSTAP